MTEKQSEMEAGSSAPLVDLARLEELVADIGEEALPEIMDMFVAEVEDSLAALRREERQAAGEIASEAHFIRGSALNLGFMALAEACGKVEKLAAAAPGTPVATARIAALFDRSRAELERLTRARTGT